MNINNPNRPVDLIVAKSATAIAATRAKTKLWIKRRQIVYSTRNVINGSRESKVPKNVSKLILTLTRKETPGFIKKIGNKKIDKLLTKLAKSIITWQEQIIHKTQIEQPLTHFKT